MSQWVPVSYRAREELWIPEISVINILDIKRIGLLEETGIIRVRGDKELFRYQCSDINYIKNYYQEYLDIFYVRYLMEAADNQHGLHGEVETWLRDGAEPLPSRCPGLSSSDQKYENISAFPCPESKYFQWLSFVCFIASSLSHVRRWFYLCNSEYQNIRRRARGEYFSSE